VRPVEGSAARSPASDQESWANGRHDWGPETAAAECGLPLPLRDTVVARQCRAAHAIATAASDPLIAAAITQCPFTNDLASMWAIRDADRSAAWLCLRCATSWRRDLAVVRPVRW
jgi:hypothetical protein